MKIPSLLAQYFYTNQRLELPGLGSFALDISSISSLQNSKQRSAVLEGVSFESNASLKESSDLIAFIAEKTGKMKALASADLDSHLQLSQQFLNMGKPISFEGIVILSRIKPGEYEFTPISIATDKIKELNTQDVVATVAKEESASRYESFLSPKTKFEWKKPVIGLMLLCGVGLTIWGGYVISQKKDNNKIHTAAEKIVPEMGAMDSLQKTDSIVPIAQTVIAPDNNYKYVLEVAKSKRAFKRYNQLKDIRWKVMLETKDSIQYKLYMLLPSIADTTRTLDSLMVMTGRKVYIEYSN